jgi:hypothetical protein
LMPAGSRAWYSSACDSSQTLSPAAIIWRSRRIHRHLSTHAANACACWQSEAKAVVPSIARLRACQNLTSESPGRAKLYAWLFRGSMIKTRSSERSVATHMDKSSENLVAMTVRLEPVVGDALKRAADREGREIADFAVGVLIEHVLPLVEQISPPAARRLQAEIEIKARAIAFAQQLSPEHAFDPSLTLKVFQAIRTQDELRRLYSGRSATDRATSAGTRSKRDSTARSALPSRQRSERRRRRSMATR